MSDNFEAEVRTSIMAITNAVDDLARSQKKAETASRHHVDALKKGFQEAAQKSGASAKGMRKTADETKGATDRARGLTDAMGHLGGPIAEIAGHLGGSFGQGGLFGRMAAGLTLAAFAARSLMMIEEKQIQLLDKQLEMRKRLNDAIAAGQAARGGGAMAGMGNMASMREVIAAGGDQAVGQVDAIVGRGRATPDDAAAAVAQAYREFADSAQRAVVLMAAERAAGTGEVSMGEAVDRLSGQRSDVGRMAGQANSPAAQAEIAHRLAARALVGDITGISERDRRARIARAEGRVARSETSSSVAAFETAQGKVGDISTQQRKDFLGPVGAKAVAEEVAKAMAPVAAAQVEAWRHIADDLYRRQQLADQESTFGRIARNALMTFGGEGSYRNQLWRAQMELDEGGEETERTVVRRRTQGRRRGEPIERNP